MPNSLGHSRRLGHSPLPGFPQRLGHARAFRFTGLMLLAAAVLWAGPGRVGAQVSRLDKGQLIKELADRHMSELLDRLLKVDPPRNKVEAAQLRIQQALLRYRDPNLSRDQQVQAFNRALQARRQMIESNPNNRLRPIWLGDLAQMLLIQRVEGVGNYAGLFEEFGIATKRQRKIFASSAVEALEATSEADRAIYDLRGKLGRDAKLREGLESSGLMRRIEEYEKARIPYFFAKAAYDVALLPTDAAYYQNLGQANGDSKILGQKNKPDAERKRLLSEALSEVKPLAEDTADPHGIGKSAMSLAGRIEIARGHVDDAISEMLNPVINDANLKQSSINLAAALGKAHGLTVDKSYEAAQDLLNRLKKHPLVANQPGGLLSLLIADALHRSLMADVNNKPADQQKKMRQVAYRPYETFLKGLSNPQRRGQLRNYIFSRWANRIPDDANPEKFPPFERMAAGEIARAQAQDLLYNDQGQPVQAKAARQQARDKATRAVALNESLTDKGLDPYVRARGMFNLGASLYVREMAGQGQSVKTLLHVIDLMTSVAQEMPDQSIAPKAMQNAIAFARQLYDLEKKPKGAAQAYKRAAGVLFDKYPKTKMAANERLYYAYNVLQENGQYAKAVDIYTQVDRSSPDYFAAQREKLFCLQKQYQQMSGASKVQRAHQHARESAEKVLKQAEQAMGQGSNSSSQAKAAAGTATLVLADVAEQAGRTDHVLELLKNFETRFKGNPGLVQRGLEKRILTLVKANRLETAADQAKAMMSEFPQFGASVVSDILDTFESRIDQKLTQAKDKQLQSQKTKLQDQARKLADTAVRLSNVLFDWAKNQGKSGEQLLAYKLIRAKSLRLTGKPANIAQAKKIIVPLLEKPAYSNQGQVVREAADVLYAAGKSLNLQGANAGKLTKAQQQEKQDLTRARKLYNRLIGATKRNPNDMYWHSWLGTLKITAQLNEETAQIPLRIRQLQQTKDPNLGGPQFKPEFERLRDKYQ